MEAYIKSLIDKEVIPGISLLAAQDDRVVFSGNYGFKRRFPQEEILKENTIYDVASLTKPFITSFLILYLVEKGEVTLQTPVREIFPQLNHFRDMTLLHLLTHTSGLPAWYPFYLFGDEYLSQYETLQLSFRPGRRLVYSCPGYILLYYIIEKVTGASFEELARRVIFEPLQLKDTFLKVPDARKAEVAATERGNAYQRDLAIQWAKGSKEKMERVEAFPWREEIIQGETDDLYSFHLGGSAGNAGLFSTTRDLLRIALEFYPESATLLTWETLRHFWRNYTPFKRSHRTAGFRLNSSIITSGGRAFSWKAVGHNGFTGTSVWMDRHHKSKKNTTVILLTNLIHPRVPDINFRKIQRKLNKHVINLF